MEHCIFDRYQSFFVTGDDQFGFKKGYGCSHAFILLAAQLIIIIPMALLSTFAQLT
jgi:hypothetical protein